MVVVDLQVVVEVLELWAQVDRQVLQDLAEVLVQVVVVGHQEQAEVQDLQALVEQQGRVEQVVEDLPHLIMLSKEN